MRSLPILISMTVLLAACEDLPQQGKAQPTRSEPAFKDDFQSRLSKEDQDKVLAKVGDQIITLKDYERAIESQPPYARARYIGSPERQKEFLDNLIRFEVLAAEARRKGYDRHPEVIQAMKQTMVRKLMTSEVQSLVKMSDITDQELQAYYEAHRSDYHKPEQRRVSQIVVETKAEAEKILAELEDKIAKDRRNYRKIFAEAARKYSIDEQSKARGGDLRFFARTEEGGEQPKALSDAAFAIEQVGQFGEIVHTDKGWHVILLTGRKNRYDRSFEQVKRQIQNRLYREKKRKATEDYVAKLRKAAHVERHDEFLDLLAKRPASPPPPPSTTGRDTAKHPPAGPKALKGKPSTVSPPGGGKPVRRRDQPGVVPGRKPTTK